MRQDTLLASCLSPHLEQKYKRKDETRANGLRNKVTCGSNKFLMALKGEKWPRELTEKLFQATTDSVDVLLRTSGQENR